MFATGLVNLVIIGPTTTKIMLERKQQGEMRSSWLVKALLTQILEKKDGKLCIDPAPHSKEMQKLNKAFGQIHGVSSLLNMAGLLATVWYGVTISERLQ